MFRKPPKILPDDNYPNADAYIYTKPKTIDIFSDNLQTENATSVEPIQDSTETLQQIGNKKNVLGSIKKNTFFGKNKYDIDLNLVKDTCIENLNIYESELGMLIFEKNKLGNNRFKSSLSLYCHIRNTLNSYPDFYKVFPNTYINCLSCAFNVNEKTTNFINNVMNLVANSNFEELSTIEVSLASHPGDIWLNKKNTKLFSEKPTRITKKGGRFTKKRKTKKRRQNKNK